MQNTTLNHRRDTYHLPRQQAKLTPVDLDLIRTFKTLCRLDNLQTFTSDDFRMYGLDRYLKDKAHGIGGTFARWIVNGVIVETGLWRRSGLASNHGRKVRVYRWSQKQ